MRLKVEDREYTQIIISHPNGQRLRITHHGDGFKVQNLGAPNGPGTAIYRPKDGDRVSFLMTCGQTLIDWKNWDLIIS